MWFLEHESLFGGKRVWLRPGSKQLFGRTKGDGRKNVFIDHKAVSRQHMMIKVLPVLPGEGVSPQVEPGKPVTKRQTHLKKRSRVEVSDLSCRQGTIIDGNKKLVSKKEGREITTIEKVTLDGTEHTITISANYPPFR